MHYKLNGLNNYHSAFYHNMPSMVLSVGLARGIPAHCQDQVEDLNKRFDVDIREAFMDGSFAPAFVSQSIHYA